LIAFLTIISKLGKKIFKLKKSLSFKSTYLRKSAFSPQVSASFSLCNHLLQAPKTTQVVKIEKVLNLTLKPKISAKEYSIEAHKGAFQKLAFSNLQI
jgi:hypothetical protein